MKNLLRFSALLTVALMLFVMIGCGEEDEEEKDTKAPTIASVSVTEGAEHPANAAITVTFSEKMGSATITVTGATGSTALDATGKMATWTPTGNIPEGDHTLTVTGEDVAGNALEGATPVNFKVIAADTTPPEIDDASCDPENGASGVDPQKVDKITIVFNEPMKEAKVLSFEPKTNVDSAFDGNKTITISFLGGARLGNEQEVKVTLSGKDKAGNDLKTTEYTFATMKKEE